MRKAIPLAVVLFALTCVASTRTAGAGDPAPAPSPHGKMPGTLILGSLVSEYGVVTFDHPGHVDMADGCGDCHHQHGTGKALECRECHSLETAAFRRSVNVGKFRPCKECHPGTLSRDDLSRPALKAAYHRACFQCHRGEVGSVGEDPKGCTEMCHEKRELAKRGSR